MSTKYKSSEEVPTGVLVKRLRELVSAVTKGSNREFYMRIPAEVDRDADLVLMESAKRLGELEVLRKRERSCPTMLESQCRALVRALQEIAVSVGLDPLKSSPRETVEAVRKSTSRAA